MQSGMDLKGDRMAIQRVRDAVEKAKIELSSTSQTEIDLPFITADDSGPRHINTKLLRSQFGALVSPLIQRTVEPCKKSSRWYWCETQWDQLISSNPFLAATLARVSTLMRLSPSVPPFKELSFLEMLPIFHFSMLRLCLLVCCGDFFFFIVSLIVNSWIETLRGIMTKFISRNATTIPTKKSQVISTAPSNCYRGQDLSRRTRTLPGQRIAWQFQPCWHSTCAQRCSSNRDCLRHSTWWKVSCLFPSSLVWC